MIALFTAWILLGLITAVVVCVRCLDWGEDRDLLSAAAFFLSVSCLLAWPLWWVAWLVEWVRK